MSTIRCVAVCLILAALPGVARAQDSPGPVSLGLQAGVNVADLAGTDNEFAPHDRFGFIGGGFLKLNPSDRYAIQLDVLYVQKGGEENTELTPEDPEDQFFVNYVELPLLFKVVLSTSGVRPEIFAGPSLAFEVSCSYDAFPGGQSDRMNCSEVGIQTRSLDLGIALGADVEIPLGSGYVVVDGRGIVGLRSIDASDESLDIRNRFLSLMVGYRFPL